MNELLEVTLLAKSDWKRLKEIRLRALMENPEAFGETLESVMVLSKNDWLKY